MALIASSAIERAEHIDFKIAFGQQRNPHSCGSMIDDEECSNKLRQGFAGDDEMAGFVPFRKAWFFAEDCTVIAKVKFDRQRIALECFRFFVPHDYDGFCEHPPLLACD